MDRYRKPIKILELKGEKIIQPTGEDGSAGFRCELLSPDWALTSKFSVAVLTLAAGAELLAKKTACVEFYYVIKGDGILAAGENKERISSGSAFIVDPGR
jgi:mannose-6-phosphate isomerase-like protein (cupin superfamily)